MMGEGDGKGGIYDSAASCDSKTVYSWGEKINLTLIGDPDGVRCTSGYSSGFSETCQIGLTKFPDPGYTCPGLNPGLNYHSPVIKYMDNHTLNMDLPNSCTASY